MKHLFHGKKVKAFQNGSGISLRIMFNLGKMYEPHSVLNLRLEKDLPHRNWDWWTLHHHLKVRCPCSPSGREEAGDVPLPPKHEWLF
ncbi:hypothetical protein AVEN_157612-1 [Araneus ventricosus]|uniref:Uncharacterized protein n=1 Tax=Araneus ventricosus TaxID=182803 RepID=A0A4Y2L8F4_ARAVE|nr:hypothetical protein AVEN_157612-1 [Araneus ventricosus]